LTAVPLVAPQPTRLRADGTDYDCRPGESVLQALLRQGVEVPYSCKKGVCLTCLMRCTGGDPGGAARAGLKETLRAQGYFLACQSQPAGDLELAPAADADLFIAAEVAAMAELGADVRQLLLKPLAPFDYRPGQFINLRGAGGIVRSYSLASHPRDAGTLELHVRRYRNGAMSGWIFGSLRAGQRVEIQGPNGTCFYLPRDRAQPLLLIGTGTGLAPLLGIVRDALSRGHTGPIRLYHGSRSEGGLYMDGTLAALSARAPNFSYARCVSGDAARGGLRAGRADDLAFADLPALGGWGVFLCGNPPMVESAKKRAYLAGADLKDIHADPFEVRDLRRRPRN
jgi:NAD(P)H-flavin reductase